MVNPKKSLPLIRCKLLIRGLEDFSYALGALRGDLALELFVVDILDPLGKIKVVRFFVFF